jgi:hypothetical protein
VAERAEGLPHLGKGLPVAYIIGGNLNLPSADWSGNAECTSGSQAFVNRLVWENGYTLVVDSPTLGDPLLEFYLVRPESSFTSCSVVQVISNHCGILLEVQWEENYCRPRVERLVSVYIMQMFRPTNFPPG